MTTEAERQFYLSHMGVHLWYAREPLPGAAPSPDFDFTEPELDRIQGPSELPQRTPLSNRLVQNRETAQGNVRDLLKSIGGDGAKEQGKPPLGPRSAPVEPEAGHTEQRRPEITEIETSAPFSKEPLTALDGVRLDLGFWISQSYCLVSTLSADVSEELQGQLASNILRALNEEISDEKRLVWPIFNNPAVMKNAHKDFSHLLERIHKTLVGRRRLIALGPLAQIEEQHQVLLSQFADNPVCGEHGLAALAADARHKKDLWQLLREELLGGE